MTCITSETENRYTAHHRQRETSAPESARQNRYTNPLHTASAERSHTAAYRMARDPEMPLTDIQWILGHARLSTTQIYLTPVPDDVIASVLAFHERRARPAPPQQPGTGPGYRAETLRVLFGENA